MLIICFVARPSPRGAEHHRRVDVHFHRWRRHLHCAQRAVYDVRQCRRAAVERTDDGRRRERERLGNDDDTIGRAREK